MRMFWIDEARGTVKSYPEFIHDLNQKNGSRKYILYREPYRILLEMIHSLVSGKEIELLDTQLGQAEISRLGIESNEIEMETAAEKPDIQDFPDLLSRIDQNKDRWRMAIYTSGTTGRPKRVVHTLATLTRNVKLGSSFSSDVWAFAYNPSHFAGLQVFFQAFFNQNPLIYVFESDRKLICQSLLKYSATHISATPTFYRTLLPYMEQPVVSVRRISVGGEKYDPSMEANIAKWFPNAKIRNIYASTEAGSLFGSEGEVFRITDSLIGKVKVSDEGELLVHKSLLGYSEEYVLVGEWYHTGDIVQLVDDSSFKFAARKTEMINVGGYKVNPHEVEEEIRRVEGVADVLVKARANRITGSILTADITMDGSLQEEVLKERIRKQLSSRLQEWKVPRLISVVKELPKTRTGKRVRG